MQWDHPQQSAQKNVLHLVDDRHGKHRTVDRLFQQHGTERIRGGGAANHVRFRIDRQWEIDFNPAATQRA